MIQRVAAAADVERVAVRQEGAAAMLADQIAQRAGIVVAQEGDVARLAKVHLDGHVLVLHIDGANASGFAQAAEFLQQVFVALAAEVGKVYLGGHGDTRSFHGQKPAIYPHYTACAQICNG